MSGEKGEEAHNLYKEEDGSHISFKLMYDIWLYGPFGHINFFSCLAKIAVLFSTGCSRAGIPPLSLRILKGILFSLYFHIQELGQAPYFIYNADPIEGCVDL